MFIQNNGVFMDNTDQQGPCSLLSDGPDSPHVEGPNKVPAGALFQLNCTAHSWPEANITWLRQPNGSNPLELAQGRRLDISVVKCLSEDIICKAENEKTGVTTSKSYRVDVFRECRHSDSILSNQLTSGGRMGLSLHLEKGNTF